MSVPPVHLVLAPSERSYLDAHALPPLPLGILKAVMAERGYEVRLSDLNRVLRERRAAYPRSMWAPLLDPELVLDYLNDGREGAGLEAALRAMDELLDILGLAGAGLLGMSCGANLSFLEMHFSFVFARRANTRLGLPVVLGGGNIQYLFEYRKEYEALLAAVHRACPFVVTGPGEAALVAIYEGLRDGVQLDRIEAPGLLRWIDGRPELAERAMPAVRAPDFSGLALEPYEVCLDTKAGEAACAQIYRSDPHALRALSNENRDSLPEARRETRIVVPFVFNYHCPYRCAFCAQSSASHGRDWSLPEPEAVADMLADLRSTYGSRYFAFFDNAFNATERYARELCGILIERKLDIVWSDCARFEGLDDDLLRAMHAAGCRKLVFGLESASERLLRGIGKPVEPLQALSVLQACARIGIICDMDVIAGLPGETLEDFEATSDFLSACRPLVNAIRVNKLYIMPSSGFGRDPAKYGLKLHRLDGAYRKLCEASAKAYALASHDGDPRLELVSARNSRLYSYSESGGRDHGQVFKESQERYGRLRAICDAPRGPTAGTPTLSAIDAAPPRQK